MAGNIKGITIEIGGNTQKLSAALKQVNKESKDMQSELKKVEKLLKLDPTNTELLAQKQEILTGAIEATEERLQALQKAGEKAHAQLANGEISREEFRELQREIIKAEQELDGLKAAAAEASGSLDKLASNLSGVGSQLSDIGGKMSAGVTAPIAAGFTLAVEGTRELRGDLAKLKTNVDTAGGSIEKTNEALEYLEAITGETDSNVEALSNLLQAGFTDNQLLEAVNALSGAVIKFPDTLKIEGLADGLEETLATGAGVGPFAEMIERLGYNLDEFNEGLADASERGEQTQYVLDFLANTGLADVNQKFKENNQAIVDGAAARLQLQQQIAEIGNSTEPIMTTITALIAGILAGFNELDAGTQQVIFVIVALVAAIGPLLSMFGMSASGISAIIALLPTITAGLATLGGAFSFLATPIGASIAAITALIAIFAVLWATNEEFRNNFTELWMSIKEFVRTTMADTTELFSSAFDAILLLLGAFIKLAKGDFSGFLKDIITLITQAIPRMYQAGKDLFNNMWTGMQEIWASLQTWVANACDWLLNKLMFWRKTQDEMASDGADGSHAMGLSYVPFDGYRAILHEGEAVLTKAENREYREGVSGGGGNIVVTQNFYDKQNNPVKQQRQAVREMRKLKQVMA